MSLLLPPPENENTPHGQSSPQGAQRQAPRIPSVDEILEQLQKLDALVLLGLPAAKANVIQRSLRIMLETQLRRSAATDQGLPNEALAELCRRNPAALNLVAPFLPEEQLDWLRKNGLNN
jgi:hypothetical protein